MATATGSCCWCGRTNTKRRPANPAVGQGGEECVNARECIAVTQRLIDEQIAIEEAKKQP